MWQPHLWGSVAFDEIQCINGPNFTDSLAYFSLIDSLTIVLSKLSLRDATQTQWCTESRKLAIGYYSKDNQQSRSWIIWWNAVSKFVQFLGCDVGTRTDKSRFILFIFKSSFFEIIRILFRSPTAGIQWPFCYSAIEEIYHQSIFMTTFSVKVKIPSRVSAFRLVMQNILDWRNGVNVEEKILIRLHAHRIWSLSNFFRFNSLQNTSVMSERMFFWEKVLLNYSRVRHE